MSAFHSDTVLWAQLIRTAHARYPYPADFIGMTYALARTSRLKVGTGVAVLPGRHPVLVAKQLATLAGLAPRRVLPVFGLKLARPSELAAFPLHQAMAYSGRVPEPRWFAAPTGVVN